MVRVHCVEHDLFEKVSQRHARRPHAHAHHLPIRRSTQDLAHQRLIRARAASQKSRVFLSRSLQYRHDFAHQYWHERNYCLAHLYGQGMRRF